MYPALYDFHYGIGNTYGYNGFDKVCLTKENVCTDSDFSHFLIGYQQSLDGMSVSGLVGLSPAVSAESRNDLLVDKLLANRAIDERVFSFSVNLDQNITKMTFGGFDEKAFGEQGYPMHWFPVDQNSSSWWTLPLDNCTFEKLNSNIADENAVVATKNTSTVIVDSGTSYVLINKKDRK